MNIKENKQYNNGLDLEWQPKHYVPATKEWRDSVYSFNKKYLKYIPVNNNTATRLIKSHFFFSNLKTTARSKRMRNLIVKKSVKRIFVSKPYIKHNNDRVIINISTFNREKQFLIRKLFFYKKKQNLLNLWLKNPFLKKIKKPVKEINTSKNKHLPLNGLRFRSELDLFKFKTTFLYKKIIYIKNIFMYIFLCKILSLLKINVIIPIVRFKTINSLTQSGYNILIINNNNLVIINPNELEESYINSLLSRYRTNNNRIGFINKMLFNFIEQNFVNKKILTKSNVTEMYTAFKNKYIKKLYYNFFIRDTELNYITSLWFNNLKFNKLLSNLKSVIAGIYKKDAEFNIVNLKYPFLDSDVYGQIIANRAQKDISSRKVLGSSLRLTKIPESFMYQYRERRKLNRSIYKSFGVNNIFIKNTDINNIISKFYPNYLVNRTQMYNKYMNTKLNKVNEILNSLKFKWVSGVRLQAAGRLTRRFSAERSVFNSKYKGNLRNEQYFIENDKLKIMSSLMLRNTVKSNSQFSFIKSKKRIGSFGIKTWVNSY